MIGPCVEFKYLVCVLEESGADDKKYLRKFQTERKVVGIIRSLVNARRMLECARVQHGALLVPVLMYSNKTMIEKKGERSKTRVTQMTSLRSLLGIRTMDKVSIVEMREVCGVTRVAMKAFYGCSDMRREWRTIG